MPGTDRSAGSSHRWLRRRLNLHAPWWVLARNLGVFGLGVAAIMVAAANLYDERGENRTVEALEKAQDRQAFEQECRYDLAQPVEALEAQQIDILVDLAIARARQDVAALQKGLADLAQLREDKTAAVQARAGAVAECNRRARALFGTDA